jgi:putative thioredoxin
LLKDAQTVETLRAAVEANPGDLRARHLLGAHAIVEGDPEGGLQQFMEMLRRDRAYEDGLPRKALIDAFRIIDDGDLVGRYRRQMSALLLS